MFKQTEDKEAIAREKWDRDGGVERDLTDGCHGTQALSLTQIPMKLEFIKVRYTSLDD